MARRKAYKNITIHPAQGGALIGSASDDVPITQESNYLSSSANYTEKVNFRRETDGELRREGWELFSPSGNLTDSWGSDSFDPLDAQFPIRAIHQFPGTDGNPVLIAIAGSKLFRLFSSADTYAKDYSDPNALYASNNAGEEYWVGAGEDFYWQEIYEFENYMDKTLNGRILDPFEGGAYRWEIVDVQNHVIINNGVDLPVVYKSEYSQAEPLYGLRENGVSSVGTIGVFQDRLFCADLTLITDGFDTWFTDDTVDHYGNIITSSLYGQVKLQRFQYRMIYSAEGEPKLFNTGIVSGNSVVMESGGLPATLTVTSSGEYLIDSNYNYAIGTPGSMYKLRQSGIFQGEEAYTLNMVSPISAVKTVNEDPNSLLISGIFAEQSTNGYKLVDSGGSDLILTNPSTASVLSAGTYTVVLRPYAEQLKSPASVREFSQDGSRILKMKALADKLVVYRDSGFFFISKTTSAEVPFAIEPRYIGGRVADFRHTIIDVDGKQHIFMGNSGIYAINRSSTEPQPISMFEIGPPFWQNVPPELAEYVYAADNPITREVFINCPLGLLTNSVGEYIDEAGRNLYDETLYDYAFGPGLYVNEEYWLKEGIEDQRPRISWGVVAYDYINKTLSTIDASFTACAYIRRPKHNRVGPEQAWFVMGIHQVDGIGDFIYPGTQYREDYLYGGVLVRYGYGPPEVNEREPYRLYNRLGYGYESRLKSGLIDFGDSFSDKEVRTYVLELSSKYGTTPTRVKISTTTSPQGTEQIETMQVVDGQELDYVELNKLQDENMIPMYVQAPYIRDEITVLPEYDYSNNTALEIGYVEKQEQFFTTERPYVKNNPIKIVGRTFEVSGLDTRSATQAVGQG